MEIKAQLRFLHLSPRKVKAVTDVIRGLSVKEAEAQLLLIKKRVVRPILKLLYSALANARNTYSLQAEDLRIKRIEVHDGPTLHRWFPRAFGRAAPIRRRSSHLLIILEPQKETLAIKKHEAVRPQKSSEEAKTEEAAVKEEKKTFGKKKERMKVIKKETRPKEEKGFTKKIFSRKSI